MLDSASLVMAALLVTIVLQIVLIVLVLDLKKKKKNETVVETPATPDQRDFRKPKEPDNRFNRRPPHENKIRPAVAQGQNIDQVERSLRDINLRLKNAEKDQEKERRRIKDTISPSSSPSSSSASSSRRFDNHKPRERDDRFRRNDRPRQDYQQNRPADSSQGFREEKNASRANFDAQEKRPPQFQSPAPIVPIVPIAPIAPIASVAPIVAAPEISAIIVEKASEPIFETPNMLSETKENLQHGRKVAVKRRILNLEENQSAESSEGVNSTPSPELVAEPKMEAQTTNAPNAAKPSQVEDESFGSGPISFGR
jgi:hypothetical protein